MNRQVVPREQARLVKEEASVLKEEVDPARGKSSETRSPRQIASPAKTRVVGSSRSGTHGPGGLDSRFSPHAAGPDLYPA